MINNGVLLSIAATIAVVCGIGILAAGVILYLKKTRKSIDVDNAVLFQRENTHRTISIIFNFIWGILLVPVTALSVAAGIATIMIADNGIYNSVMRNLVVVDMLLFLCIPIMMLASIIISIVLRKKGEHLKSVIVQVLPIATAVVAFGVLYLLFFIVR